MPSPDIITIAQFTRLVGTADARIVVDVRTEEGFAKDPRSLPGTVRRDFRMVASWVAGTAAGGLLLHFAVDL